VASMDRGRKYLSEDITKFTEKIKHCHQQKTEDMGVCKRGKKEKKDKVEK
jgi:hypothetical protein